MREKSKEKNMPTHKESTPRTHHTDETMRQIWSFYHTNLSLSFIRVTPKILTLCEDIVKCVVPLISFSVHLSFDKEELLILVVVVMVVMVWGGCLLACF